MSVNSVILYTEPDIGICADCTHALLTRGSRTEEGGVVCLLGINKTGGACSSYQKRIVLWAFPDLVEGINGVEAFGKKWEGEQFGPFGVCILWPVIGSSPP